MNALFRWVPPFVLARLRTLALRMAGVKIGAKTIFWDVPTIVGAPPVLERLRIGTFSGFNKGCYFDLEADVVIGNHVAVGHDVAFLTGGHELGEPGQRAGRRTGAPISVGDGVWLGARCVILAGVTIGAGSVIGAGMVVGQDVPENTLLAGPRPVSIARWR